MMIRWVKGPEQMSFQRHISDQQIHEKCSASLITKAMQIKTMERYHLTPTRKAVLQMTQDNRCFENVEKREPFVHCRWECKLVQPLWKAVWRFLKKFKKELPFDTAIPFLCVCPKEMK